MINLKNFPDARINLMQLFLRFRSATVLSFRDWNFLLQNVIRLRQRNGCLQQNGWNPDF